MMRTYKSVILSSFQSIHLCLDLVIDSSFPPGHYCSDGTATTSANSKV